MDCELDREREAFGAMRIASAHPGRLTLLTDASCQYSVECWCAGPFALVATRLGSYGAVPGNQADDSDGAAQAGSHDTAL